jgi:vacuolar-type H+-ATPase subunit I/STV1
MVVALRDYLFHTAPGVSCKVAEKAQTEEYQATTPRGLWLLVVLPPIIGAIQMETDFVLVRQACSAQRNLALYGVTVAAMVLTVVTALVAFGVWKRAGTNWPSEDADLAARIRFISVLGILSSAMSFLLMLAQGIATVHFDPCQR